LALLRQAAFDPVTRKAFEEVQLAYQSSGGDSEDLRTFNFEAFYANILGGILESGIKLKIFIDALNVCSDPDKVLTAVKDVSKKSPGNIQLLFSSTHIKHVRKIIKATVVDTHSASSKMQIDMMTFIRREVQDIPDYKRLLEGQMPDVEDELIEILSRRAGGMYDSLNLSAGWRY
jgi:hypothetical protein